MNKGIYIATLEPHSGKSIITLGLMNALLGRMAKVGYFRPVVSSGDKNADNHINTFIDKFNISIPYEEMYGVTRDVLIENRNSNRIGESLDIIIEKYKKIESQFDFVLVEGTDFIGESSVFEFDWNVNIAKNLGLPTLIVSSGVGKGFKEFNRNLEMAYQIYNSEDVEVVGVVANKIQPENIEELKGYLDNFLPEKVEKIIIPMVDKLKNPTVAEIANHLGAKLLFGEELLSNLTGKFAVGAMQLPHFLNHIQENGLVITPGDRADIILGSIQAHISSNYPQLSGIVLTGGILLEETINQLLTGLEKLIPILSVETGTFETTQLIGSIPSRVTSDNQSKIEALVNAFNQYVNPEALIQNVNQFQNKIRTPRMFQYDLINMARKEKKKIVLPEALDERILSATARLSKMGLVDIVLLGNEEEINNKIKNLNLNIDFSSVEIIDPHNFERFEEYTETFYELRKHKGINKQMAEDTMYDVSYFGTMMIYKNDAHGMVSGAVHTTQHTIRPALQFIKTKPGCSIVSSVFFMCLDDRVSVMGDCAINPNPTAEQLAEIAISSADSSKAFGIEPRIAMLSYSSGSSGKGEDVDRVREATKIVKEKRPDLKVEGPIQYDAAVDASVGLKKLPDSEVAGSANVLIFPDLNTGNNTYKAVQRETGAIAIGPMLQGLNKPVNDLSRGCTTEDVFNTIILTAIQAQDY
ncbi:phosphate acetyltransferase [Candidatus Ornithobacterium hominis]|uniref:phosphate acetyltransferase n=1 Tax=Candidatus Ornithobacterium hominis TaxID=2497989 RepID=UPI0024BC8106|nr:phosphate acetyltransferase [Candidatus Ornithobacterium hominis]CAI9429468.1 phosphate acetyltransferase [Candidatus Ornithobacterium hominis]